MPRKADLLLCIRWEPSDDFGEFITVAQQSCQSPGGAGRRCDHGSPVEQIAARPQSTSHCGEHAGPRIAIQAARQTARGAAAAVQPQCNVFDCRRSYIGPDAINFVALE
jgi:hypothetical protein